ncbi:hypothetical protein EON65_58790 [archaeon]|nr:MAG: hypothetical protein EON65_58790 [archaeon]
MKATHQHTLITCASLRYHFSNSNSLGGGDEDSTMDKKLCKVIFSNSAQRVEKYTENSLSYG